MSETSSKPFTRNRLTWLAYCMLGFIAINQTILGPLMPSLRGELGLNYTQGGLIPVALALGLIGSGLAGDWIAHRLSRRIVFWGGSLILVSGVILLGLGDRFEVVLVAVLGIGFGSSLTQVMIQALLSDQHGEHRTVALTEANVAASFSATLTPLIVGGLPRLGWSWRVIPILPFFLLILLTFFFHRVAIPDNAPTHAEAESRKNRLPPAFWLYWLVLFLIVSVEMVIAVWATDFLANVAGLGPINAALAFGSFSAAMLIGRVTGTRLTRRWSSLNLLLITLLVALVGFLLFWLAKSPALTVAGLFVAGLGISNHYPLTLSMAVGMAEGRTNEASARASLGVGTALLTAPLLLGRLADWFGIRNAYGMTVILLVIAIAIVANNRLQCLRMGRGASRVL